MAYLNPSAIKQAITDGALPRSDRLLVGGVLHTLAHDGVAWSLSTDAPAADRYKITKTTVQRIAAGTVLDDFTIQSSGFWQLAPGESGIQVGFASLLDP